MFYQFQNMYDGEPAQLKLFQRIALRGLNAGRMRASASRLKPGSGCAVKSAIVLALLLVLFLWSDIT